MKHQLQICRRFLDNQYLFLVVYEHFLFRALAYLNNVRTRARHGARERAPNLNRAQNGRCSYTSVPGTLNVHKQLGEGNNYREIRGKFGVAASTAYEKVNTVGTDEILFRLVGRVLPLELVPVPGQGAQVNARAPTKGFVQTRGIEWSLRAFASTRALRLSLRARAVFKFVLRAASTLENTTGEKRTLRNTI